MIAVLAFAACNAGCEIARPRARRLSQRDLPFASLVEGGSPHANLLVIPSITRLAHLVISSRQRQFFR